MEIGRASCRETVKYGGVIAAPVFSTIVSDVLKYLRVKPEAKREGDVHTDGENSLVVPNLIHLPREDAIKSLSRKGLTWRGIGRGEFVISQSPKAGIMVKPKTTILLYFDEESKYGKDLSTVVVPDLTGLSFSEVNKVLTDLGLKIVANGTGIAFKQLPTPGTRLSPGAIVTVHFVATGDN